MILYFIAQYAEKNREFCFSHITNSGESCMPYQEGTQATSVSLYRKQTELACMSQQQKLITPTSGR